jgi:signal transduction histidine kinase
VNKKTSTLKAGQDTIPSYMLTNILKTDSCTWFSSISGGVFSYNPALHVWAANKLLKGKNVWSTYADTQGRLWSNTDDGLFIHNGKEILQKLDADDGLNYNDFTMTAHCQLKNGTLVYGNKKGISIINPVDFEQEAWSVMPYISKLEINFKQKPISKLNGQLLLQPDEKSITLYVGIDDYLYATGAEMRYKLEKLNASWSSYQPANYPISLNGLAAGDYTLVVSIRDKSGRISDRLLVQKIRMLPYFYETSLFKLVVLLVLVVALVFVANLRARRKQKAAENKLKTEQAIGAERERISRDLHDSIGARLTKIISDMDIMELQLELKQQAVSVDELARTRDYTQDTINKLRETIWTLDTKIVRLQDVFHQSKKYIERYLPANISFQCHMDEALLHMPINPEVAVNIFRILQELTQNMLKYSKATSFSVHFSRDINVKLTVWDNGIGFDFYAISKGEGLKNISRRLEEIKGTMDYERSNGSLFIIHFN